MSRYDEILDLIEDAEARLKEVTTEWEWECVTAELEQLLAERKQLDNDVDEGLIDPLGDIRKSGF